MKLLTILDCYIHNETILNKLSEFIDQLKTKGSNILLISNTNIPEQIQKKLTIVYMILIIIYFQIIGNFYNIMS